MLNEFLVLERGLTAAGFSIVPRHPDVQSPGKSSALHVRLDPSGAPVETTLLLGDRVARLWTLRNGKHNSFPFIQLKRPLLSTPGDRKWHSTWSEKWKQLSSLGEQRRELCTVAQDFPIVEADWRTWPGTRLKESLSQRVAALSKSGDEMRPVRTLIERFLDVINEPALFIRHLERHLLDNLIDADTDFMALVCVALVGKVKGKAGDIVGAPLYFDLSRQEFVDDIASEAQVGRIGAALTVSGATRNDARCDMTGATRPLHVGPFPQPSLPVLGQIYLFSKNGLVPAAHRYGVADDRSIGVDALLVQRLAGALDAITVEYLKGKTWRSVPSEKPKKSDLFIAFVDRVLEARMADMMAGDEGQEDSEENEEHVTTGGTTPASERANFMGRTERVINAIRGVVGADFRKTPVTYCMLSKVDKGNAKVILYRTSTVGEVYNAAVRWAQAQENVPNWLSLPVPTKAKSVKESSPPQIAPLQIPRLSRMLFFRGGSERAKKEPMGATAEDAFSLFLDEGGAHQLAHGLLGLILRRQGELLSGAAEARRKDAGKAKLDNLLKFDRAAALGAAAMLGVSLTKLGRQKGVYMNETAFMLGQLLAVADVVHVGYCMDVRGGDVPPTLLGNSVLTTAQSDPVKALAVLCRRWKPYAAWAKRPSVWTEADRMKDSQDEGRKRRGWAMLTAVSQARRADDLAQELHNRLPLRADDAFRAELLLGYVAGLPPKETKGQK